MSKIILLAISLLILLSNCKKDCHQNGTCAQDYRRLKIGKGIDYLMADSGSWWIYKNTYTNILDTQTMLSFSFDSAISKGNYNYSKHITVEYDIIDRYIYSTLNKSMFHERTTEYDADYLSGKGLVFGLERTSSLGGKITCFYFPFDYPSNEYCQFVGMDSTLVLQGNKFQNVAKFQLSIDNIWENSPPWTGSIYYWAKDIGLIKRKALHKSDNWELIDYKIIK